MWFRRSGAWDWLALLLFAVFTQASAHAAKAVDIAIITDGPQYAMQDVAPTFRAEIDALMRGEFNVRFFEFAGDWTLFGVNDALA